MQGRGDAAAAAEMTAARWGGKGCLKRPGGGGGSGPTKKVKFILEEEEAAAVAAAAAASVGGAWEGRGFLPFRPGVGGSAGRALRAIGFGPAAARCGSSGGGGGGPRRRGTSISAGLVGRPEHVVHGFVARKARSPTHWPISISHLIFFPKLNSLGC